MIWFVCGLVAGVVLTIPFVVLATRRTARRVRRLEQRARGAERLAELGTLTGGLAHEIKNPLSTIGLNLQLLGESVHDLRLDPSAERRIQSRIETLRAEAERLRGILEDFLSFAGRVRIDPQPVQLNEVIEQLIDFYAPQAEASGIRLRAQLDPAAGAVRLDPTLFKQAMLNLLINATQAMVDARYGESPHGGCADLIIRTTSAPQHTGDDHDAVVIHVIDTGPGIDPQTVEKIFRPYFTTKPHGTGLGLATTRRIVNEHGGTIAVHTEIGRGTDFTIQLPRNGPEVKS